jgi:hypothetical protein
VLLGRLFRIGFMRASQPTAGGALIKKAWTMEEMLVELERYEKAMEAANMTPETIQSYVDRAHRFVGWLDGDYKPSEHFDRPRYRYPEHRAEA